VILCDFVVSFGFQSHVLVFIILCSLFLSMFDHVLLFA